MDNHTGTVAVIGGPGDYSNSPALMRLDTKLGAVRVRDRKTKKLAPVASSRLGLLEARLAPNTFNAAAAWLMSQSIGSDHTRQAYADDIRFVADALADEAGDRLDITTLRPSDIGRAVDAMQADPNVSDRSIVRRLNAVQSLYSFARNLADLPDGQIVTKYNRPKVDRSALNATATRAMTADEQSRLADSAFNAGEGLAFILGVAMAGRVEELCAADLEHLHRTADGGADLVVTRKGGKVRTFPLPPAIVGLIDHVHGGARTGPILTKADGGRMTRSAFDALLRRMGHRARVWTCPDAYTRRKRGSADPGHTFSGKNACKACDHVTPHVLRATKLTELAKREGWDLRKVQQFADHASPETTAGYIQREDDKQLRAEGTAATATNLADQIGRWTS